MNKVISFVLTLLLGFVVTLLVGMVLAPFIALLWNALMPTLIGATTLTYWKAVGLFFLIGLLTPKIDAKVNCSRN